MADDTTAEEETDAAEEAELKIDWDFISAREGGQYLEGYVPDAEGSKSGVSVATGFDIGQRNQTDLELLGLSAELVEKLAVYCELTGQEAVDLLAETPLTITEDEADQIDKASKSDAVADLEAAYDKASTVTFRSLPGEAQTVIASVSFQYGSLKKKTPTFWGIVIIQDWAGAITELRDFGDSYPTRRGLEADLLEKIPAEPVVEEAATELRGMLSDEAEFFK